MLCVPAPGQGIIAIEMRESDERVRRWAARITDAHAADALAAERSLVEALGGGCQTPIGALASAGTTGSLDLVAAVVTPDGRRMLRASGQAPVGEAAALGQRVAAELLGEGASDILEEARRVQAAQGI